MSLIREEMARILRRDTTELAPPSPIHDLRALRVNATEDAARCAMKASVGDNAMLVSTHGRVHQFVQNAPEAAVDEVIDRVRECMTPAQKQILHLRATEVPYSEIAKRLKMKVKAVARAEITTLCLANRAIDMPSE